MSERAGLYKEALKAFSTAARVKEPFTQNPEPYQDLARRAARRLKSKRGWVRQSLDALVAELSSALCSRNARALKALASQTHFSVAAIGSERGFLDAAPVLDILFDDLPDTGLRISSNCLGGTGDKRYLDTFGWKGTLGSDLVRLILTPAPGGFEWGGIAFIPSPSAANGQSLLSMARPKDEVHNRPLPGDPHGPRDDQDPSDTSHFHLLDDEVPLSVTVDDLMMKSPWPSGCHFYAGGIIPFIGQIHLMKLAVVMFGPLASLFTDKLMPVSGACGFGFGGLYYGQPTTHQGIHYFSVDFATFSQTDFSLDTLVPLDPVAIIKRVLRTNQTYSQPCLAVADGIVSFVYSAEPTGGTNSANQVRIGHISSKEQQGGFALAYIIALLTGVLPTLNLRFTAYYMHLDGPSRVSVSLGMYVKQGKRLGAMDDTGNSVGDHLHFELVDTDTQMSVRPTPMDGQTLFDGDDGRCMHSTNVLIP